MSEIIPLASHPRAVALRIFEATHSPDERGGDYQEECVARIARILDEELRRQRLEAR